MHQARQPTGAGPSVRIQPPTTAASELPRRVVDEVIRARHRNDPETVDPLIATALGILVALVYFLFFETRWFARVSASAWLAVVSTAFAGAGVHSLPLRRGV